MSLRIVIDGSDVDYGEEKDLRLSINYSIADINTIGGRSTQGSRAYEIKLPATKNNKQIFGFIEQPNVINGFDHTQQKTCRVEVDGSTVINGNARIKGALNSLGKVDYYSLIILGDTATWLNAIKDLSLTALDFSDQSHALTNQNITTSYTLSTDRDYVYPLINYGQWGKDNTLNMRTINRTKDMYPAIKVKSYLTKLLNAQGYTVKSDFVDSSFFDGLIIPFSGKNYDEVLDTSFRDDRLFRARVTPRVSVLSYPISPNGAKHYFTLDDDSTTGYFDNGNDYDSATYTHTIDTTSTQEFVFNVDMTTYNHYNIRWAIERTKLDGTKEDLAFKEHKNYVSNSNVYIDKALLPDNIKTGFIKFLAGEKVRVYIQVFQNSVSNTGGTARDLYIKTADSITYFYNNVQRSYTEGNTVDLANYVHDINQLDFVKSIRDMFNLHFLTDIKKRIVYIEPRDDFYSGTAIDWTSKLNTDKGLQVSFMGSNLTRELNFKYKDDSGDANLVKYLEDKGSEYGSTTVSIDNVTAKSGTSNKEIGVFAPTFMQECPQIGIDGSKIPTIIKDLEEYEFSTAFDFRILYYDGLYTSNNSIAYYTPADGSLFSVPTYIKPTYPKAFFLDTEVVNTNGLQFQDETNTGGLYQKKHRNLYNTINNSRIAKGEFYLNAVDIETFDFRIPIVIFEGGEPTYYHVNMISNYKPLDVKLTKVELIKVINPIPQATITESTNILPPDGTTPIVGYVKAEVSSITLNVKASINGSTKEIQK